MADVDDLRVRVECFYQEFHTGVCDCEHSDAPHWCETCWQRILMIEAILRRPVTLGQEWVSRVTSSSDPDVSTIGADVGPMPAPEQGACRFRAALQAIVALDFKKTSHGGDDFFSGPDMFVRAWNIAYDTLKASPPKPSEEAARHG